MGTKVLGREVTTLVVCLLGVFGLRSLCNGDQIRLIDGSVFVGEIVSEVANGVVVKREFAADEILHPRLIEAIKRDGSEDWVSLTEFLGKSPGGDASLPDEALEDDGAKGDRLVYVETQKASEQRKSFDPRVATFTRDHNGEVIWTLTASATFVDWNGDGKATALPDDRDSIEQILHFILLELPSEVTPENKGVLEASNVKFFRHRGITGRKVGRTISKLPRLPPDGLNTDVGRKLLGETKASLASTAWSRSGLESPLPRGTSGSMVAETTAWRRYVQPVLDSYRRSVEALERNLERSSTGRGLRQ